MSLDLDVGIVSYTLGAILLGFLLLGQIRIWKAGNSSFVLLVATLITFVWCLCLLFQSSIPPSQFYLIQLAEIIKNVAWFTLLLSILGLRKVLFSKEKKSENKELIFVSAIALGLPLALLVYILVINLGGTSGTTLPGYGGTQIISAYLMISIIGLALLEQVIRNTLHSHQWHLKFLCLGLGVLFSFDLYLYSDALLFARINGSFWEVRGVIIAFAVPLIAIGVLRTNQQPIQVNISRRLVFHTSVLLSAGVYLLLMSGVGLYIRTYSGEWGVIFQALFWVISLSLLLLVAFSGKLRSVLKLYINRHVFSSKYDYRDEWLRISQTLASSNGDETLPERAVRAMADIVDSPGGALWLSRNDKHYDQIAQVSSWWLEDSGLTQDDFIIQYLQTQNQVIDLKDKLNHYETMDLPLWLDKLKKAWLIIPLMLDDKLLGFIILNDSRADIDLNWEDHDLLKTAAQQASSYLAQMLASDALSEVRQFTAFNQMSAFVVHDIKTLNSQLSLMVSNAEKHKSNPAFVDDMIKTSDHVVKKMNLLLQHFKTGDKAGGNEVGVEEVNLIELIQRVVSEKNKLLPLPVFSHEESAVIISANENELKSCLGHLIQNAQEATDDAGVVELLLRRVVPSEGEAAQGNDYIELIIKDTGSGMTSDFINQKLFKPFESTKGVTGMGIGVFQSRAIIRNLGGNLVVSSRSDVGTEFKITIALNDDQPID